MTTIRLDLSCNIGDIQAGFPEHTDRGQYKGWSMCPPGQAVVGFNTRILGHGNDDGDGHDDTTMVGVRMFCRELDMPPTKKGQGFCSDIALILYSLLYVFSLVTY